MKIGLIGDSHTEVYFPMLRRKLEAMGHTVVGEVSKRGWATYSFNKDPSYFDQLSDAEAVVVSIGGNNHRLSDSYKEHVDTFLRNVGFPKKRIIWVGPAIALRQDVEDRHAWTTQWLKKNLPSSIVFIDARDFTTVNHAPDGVHFTTAGYQLWADTIANKIKPILSMPIVLYNVGRRLPYIVLISSLGLVGYALWRRYGSTR